MNEHFFEIESATDHLYVLAIYVYVYLQFSAGPVSFLIRLPIDFARIPAFLTKVTRTANVFCIKKAQYIKYPISRFVASISRQLYFTGQSRRRHSSLGCDISIIGRRQSYTTDVPVTASGKVRTICCIITQLEQEAFHQDAYRPLQFPSLNVSTGGSGYTHPPTRYTHHPLVYPLWYIHLGPRIFIT